MDLYINDFGSGIRKNGKMFEITCGENRNLISPLKLKTMILTKGVSITTDAVELAVENNVDVLVVDKFGKPYGRFWHSRFGSTAYIRRRQIEIFENEKGIEYAKEWIINKIKNCSSHLKDLQIKSESRKEYIEGEKIKLNKYIYKIKTVSGNIKEKRNILMGYEGNAGKIYYGVLSELIPKEFSFEGRSMQPAKDEFNTLLNYTFGILYSKVEKACIIAGLDPYIGILHSDNYGKKSLVFDIIENYRHLASRTVFALFTQKKINKNFFIKYSNGIALNKEGKQTLIEAFYHTLEKKIRYNGRNISNIDKIQYDCHEIASSLLDTEDESGTREEG